MAKSVATFGPEIDHFAFWSSYCTVEKLADMQ